MLNTNFKGKFGKKAASEEKPKKRATEMTNPMNKNKNTGSPPGLTQQVEAVAEPEDPASGAEIHTDPASGRRYSYFPATGATECHHFQPRTTNTTDASHLRHSINR